MRSSLAGGPTASEMLSIWGPGMRIKPEDAFEICDVVETDYSGKTTRHIVAERFRTRNCQSGVTYKVVPAVPKSGGQDAKIDHDWFRRIGYLMFNESRKPIFVPDKKE